jgi:azurin
MKTNLPQLLIVITLGFLAACNRSSESTTSASEAPATEVKPAKEAPDPSLPEVKVEMTGNDQMKFDVTEILAKPGQKVTVTLKNIGSMPKISMGHNFVLLVEGIDPNKFVEAGTPHMGREYIAPEMEDKVIAHTKLLGPGESDTVSFAAPRNPGTYVYICSFPGHYAIGMKGALIVQ